MPAQQMLLESTAASSVTFDHFISPTGDDNNVGSLAAPWAITSLIAGSANNNRMASKRIGLIAGTYNISGFTQNTGSFSYNLCSLPAGTSSSATYLASCDTSGHYSARAATITWGTANATIYNGFLGNNVTSKGSGSYITIDGIVINGNGCVGPCGHLIQFYAGTNWSATSSLNAGETGNIVINCDLSNLGITDGGGNYALVFFEGNYLCTVQNNYLHDVTITPAQGGATDGAHLGATCEIGCYGNQYIYNTIYNTPGGIWVKEGNTGTVAAYNYLYFVGANGAYGASEACAPFMGFDDAEGNPNTGPAGYLIYQLHHNIVDTCTMAYCTLDNAPGSLASCHAWNNTTYDSIAGTWRGWLMGAQGSASAQFYNNVYVTSGNGSGATTGQPGKLNLNTSHFANVNNNCYYSIGGSYPTFWGLGSTGYSAFSTYKTAIQSLVAGSESASLNADPQFTVGTANLVAGAGPVQFQLGAGSPCLGTAGFGGTNMGAWDAGVTQIGCSFKQSGPWS